MPVDHAEAAKWYFKSANAGSRYAYSSLSSAYAKGAGVPRNRVIALAFCEATGWYDKGFAAGKEGCGTEMVSLKPAAVEMRRARSLARAISASEPFVLDLPSPGALDAVIAAYLKWYPATR